MLLRLDTNITVLKNVKLIVMEYFYNIDHVEK